MASDYISREWLMKTLGITSFDCEHCEWAEHFTYRCKRGGDFEDACCAIEDAPSADVRKNVRGEWIKADPVISAVRYNRYKCSICGKGVEWLRGNNFCPNCGADMRERRCDDGEIH